MSLQDFSVRFTRVPEAGPPKERTITVAVTVPVDVDIAALAANPLTIDLRYDSSGDEIFTTLTSQSVTVTTVGEETYEFTVLVPVESEYTLQARATLDTPDQGKLSDFTEQTIDGFGDDPVVAEGDVDAPTTETSVGTIGGQRRADVTPEVAGIEPITINTKYDLPFETASNQTDCGRTIRVQNGDRDWRIVIEAIFSLEKFRQLQQLRAAAATERVDVTTAEFGTIEVDFDNISCRRVEDAEVGEFDGVVQPLIAVQLQTKQSDTGSLFGGG